MDVFSAGTAHVHDPANVPPLRVLALAEKSAFVGCI
jgi:hypothetical protein